MAGARNPSHGGQKREFTSQVQGIGHVAKSGGRVSFEGLRFMWRAQGIRTMDPMF